MPRTASRRLRNGNLYTKSLESGTSERFSHRPVHGVHAASGGLWKEAMALPLMTTCIEVHPQNSEIKDTLDSHMIIPIASLGRRRREQMPCSSKWPKH